MNNTLLSGPMEGYTNVDAFVEALYGMEAAEAIPLLEGAYARLAPADKPDDAHVQQLGQLMGCFWNLFQGQALVHEKADFAGALQYMQLATQGFEALELEGFAALAKAFGLYYQAVVHIRTSNYQAGLDNIKAAREQFGLVTNYGRNYEPLVDALEAEGYFVAGIQELMALDIDRAQIDIEKAVNASRKVAQEHCAPDSAEYWLYMGLADYYAAYTGYMVQMSSLNTLDFGYFGYADNEAAQHAAGAIDKLAKCADLGEVTQTNLRLAKATHLLSEVVFTIGHAMAQLLQGATDGIDFDTKALKKMADSARKLAIEMGEVGIVMTRLSKQVGQMVQHVETLLQARNAKRQPAPARAQEGHTAIAELLQAGKTDKALRELLKTTVDPDLFQQLVVLSGKLSLAQKHLNLGFMSAQEAQQQESQVAAALLSFL